MLAWLMRHGAMVHFGRPVTIWCAPYPFVIGETLEEAIRRMQSQMVVVGESVPLVLLSERKESEK